MAAYRTQEKLQEEIEGKEEDDFPCIWTYRQLLHDQVAQNYQSNYFELDQECLGYKKSTLRHISAIVVCSTISYKTSFSVSLAFYCYRCLLYNIVILPDINNSCNN
jgi:hypothetical protein